MKEMKKMKVLAVLVAILLIAGATAACGNPSAAPSESAAVSSAVASDTAAAPASSAAGETKKIKVGATYQALSVPYIVTLKDSCVAQAEKLGIEIITVDGQGDAAKQVGQVENFIAQQCDVIILDPTDFNGCAPAVDEANKAGIPLLP